MNLKQSIQRSKNEEKMKTKLPIYTFKQFESQPIVQGISTRYFGSIRKKRIVDENNFRAFRHGLNADQMPPVMCEQTHSSKVAFVTNSKPSLIQEVDGLVTKKKNVLLSIVTADCMPIMFYDPKKNIVGVAHAGFKGLLYGIVQQMVDSFISLGSNPEDIIVGIGPSIQKCCYDVTQDRARDFEDRFPHCDKVYEIKSEKHFLNLNHIALCELERNGIKKDNIEISSCCTKCNTDLFFSYRGDSDEEFGEFVTVVGLR